MHDWQFYMKDSHDNSMQTFVGLMFLVVMS